jgi:uncharacterized protein YacL
MKKIIILFNIFIFIICGCASTEIKTDKMQDPLDINNVLTDIEKKESEKSMERIKYIAIGLTVGICAGVLISLLGINKVNRPIYDLDIKIMLSVIFVLGIGGGYEGNLIYEMQNNEK